MSLPAGGPSARSALRGADPDLSAPGRFSPALMMDVELAGPLPEVSFDGRRHRLFVTARLHTEPLGTCLLALDPGGLAASDLAAALWPQIREPVMTRFADAGLPPPAPLTAAGLATGPGAWPFLEDRRRALATPPFFSVVICTRDRPEQLASCLSSVGQQEYPRFEVLVVDNAPATEEVRGLAGAGLRGVPLRYVREPRPGLSWARNAGAAAASGEIIAYLDDDEEPDRHWLAGLAAGFSRGADIGCVSGVVLPAQLETPAQEWFEELGGHSKGRGFSRAIFAASGPQSPLFPLPPFGVGANMAFRREVLAAIGAFDVALGAGTPARAGEDTLALTMVLLAGYRIAYEPAALTRHHHRADLDGLGDQVEGYGIGLTAYYAALLRHRPRVLPGLLRLAPAALGYLRGGGDGPGGPPTDLPAGLLRRQRRGMLAGPLRYLRSLRTQARAAGSAGQLP
jgi:glycosyltransferase involved in cell wall biosynthesis